MTIQQEILPPEGQDIIEAVSQDPSIAILDTEKAQKYLIKVREFTAALGEVDVSKAKDRTAVKSMAAKVTTAKTGIDKARLAMTSDLRQRVSNINDAAKIVVDGLATIAKEVRAPVTAWEKAEEEREALVESTIAKIKAAALVTIADTSVTVAARGNDIYETVIDKAVFLKRFDEAEEAKTATMKALHEAMHVLKQREDAQAELDAMKAAEAERLAKEAAEKAEREAAERKVQFARSIIDHIHEVGRGYIGGQPYPFAILLHELQVKIPPEITSDFGDLEQEARDILTQTLASVQDRANEAAERAAIQAKQEAEDQAKRDAAEVAQRQIDAANARAAQAEQAAQAERKRIADKEAEDERIAEEQAAEEARRTKNAENRREKMGETKQALMDVGGITNEAATAIVRALTRQNKEGAKITIPNVRFFF